MKKTILLCLAVLALSNVISADENCFAVNPGSTADVCSWLLDKLQLAVIRNPTNIYLIKKVWSDPLPSLVHVAYEVDISNTSDIACITEGNTAELANTSTAFGDALWTDRGIFTLIHPGILQQLQLQLPYLIIQFATLFVGTNNPFGSFVLSAIQWNGCKSSRVRGLPNITLSLQVGYLPCTPSNLQLETSLLELTAWLLAFDNLQPQNELPDLDTEKRKFVLSQDFTVRSSLVTLEYIALLAYFCIFLGIYLGLRKVMINMIKQAQKDGENKKDGEKSQKTYQRLKAMFTSLLLVVNTWNILILIADIVSFVQCPPTTDNAQIFNLILFLITCLMWPMLFVILHVFSDCFKMDIVESDFKEIEIFPLVDKNTLVREFLYVNAMWNIFVFAAYFSTSAVAASLLVYAYPFEVLSMATFLVVSFVFNVLLFSNILSAAFTCLNNPKSDSMDDPKVESKVGSKVESKVESKDKSESSSTSSRKECLLYFSLVIIIFFVSFLMNIVLLATFGVAILRGLVGIDDTTGRFITLLPSIILAAVSWLLKHFLVGTTDEKKSECRIQEAVLLKWKKKLSQEAKESDEHNASDHNACDIERGVRDVEPNAYYVVLNASYDEHSF